MRTRSLTRILPNPARVALRFFVPGEEDLWTARSRADAVHSRVMALDDEEVNQTLDEVTSRFSSRHQHLIDMCLEHLDRLAPVLDTSDLSRDRRLLLGACFTQEYAVEGACVTNPSAVEHPDQTGLDEGDTRLILAVRGIGEGHRSSIGFREVIVRAGGEVDVAEARHEVFVGHAQPGEVERDVLLGLMRKPEHLGDDVRGLIDALGPRFDQVHLMEALAATRIDPFTYRNVTDAMHECRAVAERFYEVHHDPTSDLSQRVLFPRAAAEWGGMEDARFVRFVDDDDTSTYLASYTAFDGRSISGQLICTDDFVQFAMSPFAGPAAAGKGVALFPRRIDGRFHALVRPDNETLSIASSESLGCWRESLPVHIPTAPWELTQSGNAGSPIELPEGWLVLTHSVGPLRTYTLGAILLDLTEPHRVLGVLDEPLISPDDSERDGYVPNVVYSCGPALVGDRLFIPYGCADQSIGFATVPTADLLQRMRPAG
jgi:predicted GH43/DUF377 family glycosyl hydrolase